MRQRLNAGTEVAGKINTLLDRWLTFLMKAQELDRSLREAYEAEEKAKMVDAATLQFVEQHGEERGELCAQQHMLLRQMTHHIGEVPPVLRHASILSRLLNLMTLGRLSSTLNPMRRSSPGFHGGDFIQLPFLHSCRVA